MNGKYTLLLHEQGEVITRIWGDEVMESRDTQYAERLSYRQLIDHLPSLLDELGRVLDAPGSPHEIADASRRVRYFIHVRFQQGCLLDEVARELFVLREVINDFVWRENFAATERDLRELRGALKRTNTFFDELMRQVIIVYAASLRPPVQTHSSIWYPSRRRRRTDQSSPDPAREI